MTEPHEWDGTLTGGLAELVGIENSELANFDAVVGRSEVDLAMDGLVEALGGSVEFRESTDGASEQHLTAARVHVALRRDAWDLVSQLAALVISIVTNNPAEVVAAISMLRTITKTVTIMTPDEKRAVALIAGNQRKGIQTYRNDVDINLDRLLARGVLRDQNGRLDVRS